MAFFDIADKTAAVGIEPMKRPVSGKFNGVYRACDFCRFVEFVAVFERQLFEGQGDVATLRAALLIFTQRFGELVFSCEAGCVGNASLYLFSE